MTTKPNSDDIIYESLTKGFALEEVGDFFGAVDSFMIAAKLGSTDAHSMLGTILDDDIKPARPKEAVYWYKRGVRGGNSSCAWNLAMHYKEKQNQRWYLHWLGVADQMGHVEARVELKTGEWWNKRRAR